VQALTNIHNILDISWYSGNTFCELTNVFFSENVSQVHAFISNYLYFQHLENT